MRRKENGDKKKYKSKWNRIWERIMEMEKIGKGMRGGKNRKKMKEEDGEGRRILKKW